VVSLFWCILQHTCMSVEGHTLTDCKRRTSREGNAGGSSGFIARRAEDRSRIDRNKSNRGEGERKEDQPGIRFSLGVEVDREAV
jgi:hypothetical protein